MVLPQLFPAPEQIRGAQLAAFPSVPSRFLAASGGRPQGSWLSPAGPAVMLGQQQAATSHGVSGQLVSLVRDTAALGFSHPSNLRAVPEGRRGEGLQAEEEGPPDQSWVSGSP